MATVLPQLPGKVNLTSPQISYASVTASDILVNDGHCMLYVKNGNGASCTVTVAAVNACDQGVTLSASEVIPAGQNWVFGPFPVSRFGMAPVVTYSVTATVSAALIAVPS